MRVTEKMPVPETRPPNTAKHFERKLEERGLHRLERHLANAGIDAPPPKSGRGGKYTWEGPGAGEVKVAKVAESKDGVARGPCLLPQPAVLSTVDHPQVAVNSHTRASSRRKSTRACTTRVVESRHLLLRRDASGTDHWY